MKQLRTTTMTLVACVLLAMIFALAAVHAADGKNAPKFFVRNNQLDVGNYYEGADIECEFKVRNNGVGELHIINVKPG